MKYILLACALIASIPPAVGQDSCNCGPADPMVGKEFKVHGRISAWNGAPTLRIWIIGTKRILGVHGGSPIPGNLAPFTKSFEFEVVGDFVVCPLTKSKPGVMQIVCIKSASNLHPKKVRPD